MEVRLARLVDHGRFGNRLPLLELSARLGSNPLLVQAGTGNTSVKIDGVLWIKASGKWLAHAGHDEILVPVDLAETRRCVQQNADPACECSIRPGKSLRTSVETAMHAVLRHRVVLHVHSVNTIACAVRCDAVELLTERFAGLRWKWIPYTASGLPLARAIEAATAHSPETDILVLANHGLEVSGDDCETAERLLRDVEARIAIKPRTPPEPDYSQLMRLTGTSGWRLPDDPSVHALGTDAWSATVLSGGVLYPCQAIFLSPRMRVTPRSILSDLPADDSPADDLPAEMRNPFLIVEGAGVVVNDRMTGPAFATLTGLAQVLQRIDDSAPIRYLDEPEVESVMSADTYRYRELVETNSDAWPARFRVVKMPVIRSSPSGSALRLSILPLVLLLSHHSASGQQDRIAGRISSHGTVVLRGNLNPKARPRYDQGRVDADLKMDLVTLTFKPSPAQQAALNALLAEQQERSSPNYHHWITPEQYAGQFGLSHADIDRIVSWLQSNALSVDYSARGRNWIAFSGTARNMELAFGTGIHTYRVDGENALWRMRPICRLSAALGDVVFAVGGLDDFRMKPPAIRPIPSSGARHSVSGHPEYTFPAGNQAIAPDDLATIYDIAPLYANGIDGSGQRIAVAGQSDIELSDIATFRKNILPANVPHVVLVPGSTDPGITGNEIEADLDLEWSGAVARNATIIYVNSTDVLDSANYAISENLAPVLSYSFGGCEQDESSATTQAVATLAQQANAQGITLLAASGDYGAAACDSGTSSQATRGLGVLFPGSLPEVTAVGGTEFNEGGGAYWSNSNSSTLESALSYKPEIAWNDTSAVGHLAASGGGSSTLYPKPAWQAGPGVPNDGARDVPDVAMSASAQHDPYFVVSGGAPAAMKGGTSIATPVFAGIVALLNQYSGSSGEGNINPNLYRIPQTNAFHDIVSGNNAVPCESGTPDCTTAFSSDVSAGTGYDQVTGLGSVDARNLLANWNAHAPASNVVPTCNPNPVYQQQPNSDGYSWFYTVTLTEILAGVATSLTGLSDKRHGLQLAAGGIIRDSPTIAARGAVSVSLGVEGTWRSRLVQCTCSAAWMQAGVSGRNNCRYRFTGPSRSQTRRSTPAASLLSTVQ